MGLRQDNLTKLLANAGNTAEVVKVGRPRSAIARSCDIEAEIARIYKRLGGVLADFPTKFGKLDIRFSSLAVELDEQRHFNRYRAITLASPLYSRLAAFPLENYRLYCETWESECLASAKHGGYWESSGSTKQFGPSSSPGDLSEPGPSRWKQRAFYDFLKDLSPLFGGCKVIRIAIWDSVPIKGRNTLLNVALLQPSPEALPGILRLIEERTATMT